MKLVDVSLDILPRYSSDSRTFGHPLLEEFLKIFYRKLDHGRGDVAAELRTTYE